MKKFLFWIFFVGFLCVGCENVQLSIENQSSDIKQLSSSYVGKKVSFACWNVQTFLMPRLMELNMMSLKKAIHGILVSIARD